MKKLSGLLDVLKYIMIAIMLGGGVGNLICILEIMSGIIRFEYDYEMYVIIISVLSWLSFYFLFMRSGKTIYAVVFIPSVYFLGFFSVDFWWEILNPSLDREGLNIVKGGVVMFLALSLQISTVLILITNYVISKKSLKREDGKIAETESTQ